MNSFQESKNELEAAIRYAENAISAAQSTIESMEFRQEMAKKEYEERTGREEALTKHVQELESKVQGQYDDIVQLERDLKIKTSDAESWKQVSELQVTEQKQKLKQLAQQKDDLEREVAELKIQLVEERNRSMGYTNELEKLRSEKEASSGPCGCQAYRDLEERATMPVIPKAVAIAIFREGMAYGASNVCDELDNAADIEISDRECMGNFEVEYTQYVDLSEHLDTDYLRSKAVDNSDEEWVADCLKNLCADNKFECRIHGIDDNED